MPLVLYNGSKLHWILFVSKVFLELYILLFHLNTNTGHTDFESCLGPGNGDSARFSSSAGMAYGGSSSHSISRVVAFGSSSHGSRVPGVNSASASAFGANHDGEASHHFKQTVRRGRYLMRWREREGERERE